MVSLQPSTSRGTTLTAGALWELNRPIDIEFSHDIDFATVSTSTVRIADQQGVLATGTFALITPRTIRFQPRCPTDEQNSDGGFGQGRSYRLSVLTTGTGGGVTVLSTAGHPVRLGLNIDFMTPLSNDPAVLFIDTVAGPPSVRVRGLAGEPSTSLAGSSVEFGDGTVEFFEFDPQTSTELVGEIASLMPLNLYSRVEEQFSIVLRFDQAISAAASNLSTQLIGFEYTYDAVPSTAQWTPMSSTVRLLENCTETGAAVRVSPLGIVPQGSTSSCTSPTPRPSSCSRMRVAPTASISTRRARWRRRRSAGARPTNQRTG